MQRFRQLLAIFCLIFISWKSVARPIPDGLCVLTKKSGGYGKGFVVGKHVFSVAHVLEVADGPWYCTSNGRLVEITSLRTGKIESHPKYKDVSESLRGLNHSVHNADSIFKASKKVQYPYDLGYAELNKAVDSSFVLDPSENIEETVNLLSTIKNQFPESITKIDQRGNIKTLQTIHESFAVSFRFDSQTQAFAFGNHGSFKQADLFLEYDMETGPGDSGTPLYVDMPSGKLFVIGIARGDFPEALESEPLLPELARVNPTCYAPVKNLAIWLKASIPSAFWKQSFSSPSFDCRAKLSTNPKDP